MYKTLTNAGLGIELELISINDILLEENLNKIGLNKGDLIIKTLKNPDTRSVRVRMANREFILSSDMASGIVAHLDNGRIIPVSEMEKGETGHIEGKSGGEALNKMLVALRVEDDDSLTLIRKIPHMTYTVLIKNDGRIKISDSLAAKILGESDGRMIQLSSLNINSSLKLFDIPGIQPDEKAYLDHHRVVTGSILEIEKVDPETVLNLSSGKNDICISKGEELSLYLSTDAGNKLLVREIH